MERKITRRKFMTQVGAVAGVAAGWTIVPRHVLGGRGFQAPSDTLNVACIGVGGKGRSDVVGCAAAGAEIVALCDVDLKRGAASFGRFPRARRYRDFRKLLDAERDVDAVTISTPDHTHAVIAVEAMATGKHVFCQKPLARTLYETRHLAETARRTGVVTQMGNQGHAAEGTRHIREWIEAGAIGTVRRVEYWTNRPIWPQAIERPTEMHHVPSHLDWDLFLGPAPERPYHPAYHPFDWRGWWDFGTGALGDIACHSMDAAFWTLDLGVPSRIQAESTRRFEETAPASSRIVYDFAPRGDRPALQLIWRDGGLEPSKRSELAPQEVLPGGTSGQLFVGDDGILGAGIYGEDPHIFPTRIHEEIEAHPPDEKYPRTQGVYREWIDACRGDGQAGSDFARHAGPLTELVLLGNLAVRSGEVIEWDAERMEVKNLSAPNQYIRPRYRKGWKL